MSARWRIRIDTGGTFTDCWALAPETEDATLVKVLSSGRLRLKVSSTSPLVVEIPAAWDVGEAFFSGWKIANGRKEAVIRSNTVARDGTCQLDTDLDFASSMDAVDVFTGEEAPVIGVRLLTGTSAAQSFPLMDFRIASTRGTNALLEGKGAPTAFFVTKGFRDLLEIRDQRRPDLFALRHVKTEPLYQEVLEIEERLDAEGKVLRPLHLDPRFREEAERLVSEGVRVAAVALMHSYLNPEHEQQLAEVLREIGFEHVSLSSDLAPMIKLLPRAETAVVDGYLSPVLAEFLDNVEVVTKGNEGLKKSSLHGNLENAFNVQTQQAASSSFQRRNGRTLEPADPASALHGQFRGRPWTGGGVPEPRVDQIGELDQQDAALRDWCVENGYYLTSAEVAAIEAEVSARGGKLVQGNEHRVILVPSEGVVIRLTFRNQFGLPYRTPQQYLDRWTLFNEFSTAPVSFLGYSTDALGNGVILTVQPYVHGRKKTQTAITRAFAKVGFRPIRGVGSAYINDKTGIEIYDAHEDNVIFDVEGNAIPIDVWVVAPNGALSSAESTFLTMTSAGGLESRSDFRPKDSFFSGPAGGVVGAAATARACGHEKLLTFDMGGTSTDVARYDGDFSYQFQQRVANATLLSPSLRIETVASGGGSICQWTEAGLRVGPESAGADPGPACYGRGGPLTITDVNVLLGRIHPDHFGIPMGPENLQASRDQLRKLMEAMGTEVDSAEEFLTEAETQTLLGLLKIAVEQMADSIRTISIREGADPEEYALLAFGGAGPLHACEIAERLSMREILVPAEAGVLSAFGLHHAVVERFAERQILKPLSDCEALADWLLELKDEAQSQLNLDEAVSVRRQIAEMRLQGQDAPLMIEFDPQRTASIGEGERAFRQQYERIFGYEPDPGRQIELVSLRVVVSGPAPGLEEETFSKAARQVQLPDLPGGFLERSAYEAGDEVCGPGIIQDRFSTLWLKEGWTCEVGDRGTLRVRRQREETTQAEEVSGSDAIERELFRHRFHNIVEEMGAMLQRSAVSTNVKERMDFSCALLDAEGQLVINAPHIPVHLGALGLCVREVSKVLDLGPEDMAITNHPGFGGSHLPDVTVISAVFSGDKRIGYVANRAHHAEIGGIRPGSMPPNARNLEEEGVVIAPTLLFQKGDPCLDAIAEVLTKAPWPTRHLTDNLADLQAQAAANHRGVAAFSALAENHGASTIARHLDSLATLAQASFQEAWKRQPPAQSEAEEKLDDGSVIQVALREKDGRVVFDFEGTAATHLRNLNATPAIVRSAILYCLRIWTQSDLPLNEGLLRDVEILLPSCLLNPEFPADASLCPAVVGGNVETSQRLVDTVLKLFGIQACSQGTMNNFIFGNEHFGYYETIAGGAGAGPDYDGASGLHTHMTNTSITDPEILEARYPIRLHRFQIREGSGGAGEFRGGDGVVREFEFLDALDISLLTQHRWEAPYGLEGGKPGACGKQTLKAPGEEPQELEGLAAESVQPGSRLILETPGGGGWGKA